MLRFLKPCEPSIIAALIAGAALMLLWAPALLARAAAAVVKISRRR